MSTRTIGLAGVLLLAAARMEPAQPVPDLDYQPAVPRPAYAVDAGPRVVIDAAHHNYHTADGRYQPFAGLLRRDGYRVDGAAALVSAEALKGVDVFVIANALHARNTEDWSLPTPSAFTTEEIASLHTWVEHGGSLFLIADHMPFPGAAGDLARAFGAEFSNGFAMPKSAAGGMPVNLTFTLGAGLNACAVALGRGEVEKVNEVVSFVGSAFKPPPDAIPVLKLVGDFVSLTPAKAWEFSAATPRPSLDGWCQGAILKVSQGRVAIFGEAAMFSAQLAGPARQPMGMNAPAAKQNHQFLLNVMHWLTRLPGMPE